MCKFEIRKDNDGHKYRLPILAVDAFEQILEEINAAKRFSDEWYDLNANLDSRFGQYMVG